MKEKIIYIGGEFPDKDASALRILSNCKAIRDAGYEVIIISPSSDDEKVKAQTEVYSGFLVYYYQQPRSTKEWLSDLVSIKVFQDIIGQLDNVKGVICYNHHGVSLLRLIGWLHKRDIKVYADCTEWHTVSHLSLIKKLVKGFDINLRIRYAQKKVDGMIAISHFFADLYNPFTKTIVVPPLIDVQDPIWKGEQEKNKVRTFSYTGRMGIGKDLLTRCVDTFYQLNKDYDFQFKILGCSREEYLEKQPDDANKISHLGDKISFRGYASHKEAVELTKKSDFSVLIREHNRKNDSGFPTKLTESVACGTPLIATDFSDVKKYIVENNLGLIVEDWDLRAAFIKALTLSDSDLDVLKSNCKECEVFDYRHYSSVLGDFVK